MKTKKVITWVRDKLASLILAARDCHYSPCNREEHLVICQGKKFVVNLIKWECSCNQWLICSIPCKHTICCLGHTRQNPKNFCHTFYGVEKYMETYAEVMHTIAKVDLEPKDISEDIQPHPLRRHLGRPTCTRRKEPWEPKTGIKRSSIVKYKTCGGLGRNK
ncbi:hypothetical protein CFOL_v3_01817 [Cephalotus follicularis]|uniref:SWIM-type domain-containing protein n=1 Tax=Cephalotus follicularis TaxID=3775 RepID=A0A1Q3ART8_CEPFO|nr:hypothetical protein CFOL_v3_01817 [Cephalotus follicularis]